jgi:hypothetical protein
MSKNHFIRCCCVCKKVYINGEWKTITGMKNLSHTYCPECMEKVNKKIDDYKPRIKDAE